jgi:acetylornithine deacetylase
MVMISRAVLAETLAELVRTPSVNPDLVPGSSGEGQIAGFIARKLAQLPGVEVEVQELTAGRSNVVAAVGRGAGKTLMLNGHTDTVGTEAMEQPFEPVIDQDRLHGRGSFDMKASLAGIMHVIEVLSADPGFGGRVVATFVADEEYASIGTQAICERIAHWSPDAAIVTEPTALEVSVAHKGFVWSEIVTRGRAAHGSRPDLGIDAIAHMGRVLVALEQHARELAARPAHQYVGQPSIHASIISGGLELSTYPDRCSLQVERRTIPGETAEHVFREQQAILDGLAAQDADFNAELQMGLVREPFESPTDAAIVGVLSSVLRRNGLPVKYAGESGWMDSALLNAAGVPTVIFGPDGDGAHAADEWVDLSSLATFANVLLETIYEFCR